MLGKQYHDKSSGSGLIRNQIPNLKTGINFILPSAQLYCARTVCLLARYHPTHLF